VADQHQLTVTFSADEHLDSLQPDVALCLFRVTQEAVSNAVRHAHARTIRVQAMAARERVELHVIDDGVGFVIGERVAFGLGLRSIDERVRLTGGSVELESHPGRGTTLRIRIPRAVGVDTMSREDKSSEVNRTPSARS
jgi:two-component system sensor histidine kinase UhpB